MNNIELKNKCVEYIFEKIRENKCFPIKFTPKEIADSVGGYAGNVGRVSENIVKELKARGVNIQYIRKNDRRYFEIFGYASE